MKTDKMNTIATHIKAWRLAQGLSQREFAKAVKIDVTVISKIEAGRRIPGIKTLKTFRAAGVISDKDLLRSI